MSIFRTLREKRLWFYALLVLLAILSTLAFGRPLQEMLRDQNVQTVFFLIGMILTGATIITHGLKTQPSKTEITIWIGIAAVYIMFIFRLGAPERSHLIEYSVLSIFVHEALTERWGQKKGDAVPALLAFLTVSIIGVLDESVQMFLPSRVFDPTDMLFNSLAALMAIGGSMILKYARNKFRRNMSGKKALGE